jgi:hypothetical protein
VWVDRLGGDDANACPRSGTTSQVDRNSRGQEVAR